MSNWKVIARSDDYNRELQVDYDSRFDPEGEEGYLLHAAVVIRETCDVREQTIYGPNLEKRSPETLVRRLNNMAEADLTPQRVVG